MIDELWERFGYDTEGYQVMTKHQFIAALTEYGEAVRKQAVGVCREKAEFFGSEPDELLHPLHVRERDAYKDCAAAIEQMEIK